MARGGMEESRVCPIGMTARGAHGFRDRHREERTMEHHRRPTDGRSRAAFKQASTPRAVAVLGVLVAVLVAASAGAQRVAAVSSGPIYLDTSYSFGERAADLVARLTPAQRASQLVSSQAPTITSVANPLLSPTQALPLTTL